MLRNYHSLVSCDRILLAGVLFAFACSTSPPPQPVAPPLRTVDVRELCRQPEALFGSTRNSMTTRLGQPRRVDVTKIPNRHVQGVIDQRVTLDFGNIEVLLHEVPRYGSSFLARTRLSGNDPRLPVPLRIGDPAAEVRRLLGRPQAETPEKLEYDCRWELTATLNVYLERGRVRSVEWITEPD